MISLNYIFPQIVKKKSKVGWNFHQDIFKKKLRQKLISLFNYFDK